MLALMSQVAPRGNGRGRSRQSKPRCEDCYFSRLNLCALEPKVPCPTFREWHPDGLRPPQQLTFAFRQEPREQLPLPVAGSLAARPEGPDELYEPSAAS
jgi:hypothetical protein